MKACTVFKSVAAWSPTGLVLLAISATSAAHQEPDLLPGVQEAQGAREALAALGYLATDDEEEEALGPGIHLVVSREGSVAITQIKPFADSNAPAGMSATMATATSVRLQDEAYSEKLGKILKHMASESDKAPVVEGDPTSIVLPTALLSIELDRTRAFRTALEIMEICSSRDVGLWNIALVARSSSGEKRSFATPLVTDSGVAGEGGPPSDTPLGRVDLVIEVVEEGRRVDPATGEAWSGEGPFRFEDRVLAYTLTMDEHASQLSPSEELPEAATSSQETPEGKPTMAIQVRDEKALGLMLGRAKQKLPRAGLTIDAKPGTTYGDVIDVLDAASNRFSPILFVGAR